MAHITSGVEYALHSLLWMVGQEAAPLSAGDLATFQGLSPTFVAKVLPKLEKAGIVRASEGVQGGYALARPPGQITVLQVVDAIEGRKPLFACREIRSQCVLFGGDAPAWAVTGPCAIHAAMLQAEKAMRDSLDRQTLADLSGKVGAKAPPEFFGEVQDWVTDRLAKRSGRSERTRGPRKAPAPRRSASTAPAGEIETKPEE